MNHNSLLLETILFENWFILCLKIDFILCNQKGRIYNKRYKKQEHKHSNTVRPLDLNSIFSLYLMMVCRFIKVYVEKPGKKVKFAVNIDSCSY